jgi:integrase
MPRRRYRGSIRKLPSGRYQARYHGPDGIRRSAPETFPRKRDAELWLTQVEAELTRGDWVRPEAGRVALGEFADTWIAERPNLSETTRERYQSALKLQIRPALGNLALSDITEATIRSWRRSLLDAGVGVPSVAKAYRLLRAVLNTAADDGLIRRNPCRIKGASNDHSPERPVLEIDQVFVAADAVPERYRALVLLATFTGLRFGELAGLQRGDIDPAHGVLHVRRSQVELSGGALLLKSPKTEAGRRTVAIPAAVLPVVQRHLDQFAEQGGEGRVFVGPLGGPLRRQNFRRIWNRALRQAGLPPVHVHDLRHTGNTLAAGSGASLRELMARMGHASTRAAVIYQHASAHRDQAIADSLSAMIEAADPPTRRAKETAGDCESPRERARGGHARRPRPAKSRDPDRPIGL